MHRKLLRGTVQKHADGFAFLLPDEPGQQDAYVPRREAGKLMSGDKVEYSMNRRGDRVFARVESIISRGKTRLVGRVESVEGDLWLSTPDGPMELLDRKGAREGQWVIGRIGNYPEEDELGEVDVEEVLGSTLGPSHDYEIAIANYDLPERFSAGALEEAERAEKVASQAETESDRKDMRSIPLVTIDGPDAKDFDDAVAAVSPKSGPAFILYVAIADVSQFVRPGGALDADALDRATSVYFPGTCIPMLPEHLSNEWCSLRPRQKRLALTAEIHYDRDARVVDTRFYTALIQTRARLTYEEVQDYFDRKGDAREKLAELAESLDTMKALYKRLLQLRRERGALDFELPECVISIDSSGAPTGVSRARRLDSHRLIEEFMIAANQAVAKALREGGEPAVYRVHDNPDADRLDEINGLLRTLGFSHRIDRVNPKAFSNVLEATMGKPQAGPLHTVMLRAQKQAYYGVEPHGHFGLALRDYAHFTSPIRRYPDLMVHRALKRFIARGKRTDKRGRGEEGSLDGAAQLSSARERRAMEAERFAKRRKQCWYMRDRIGSRFTARLAWPNANGAFVEIPELAIEGFLPLELMDGHYEFDERSLCLVKRPGSQRLLVGAEIDVIVEDVEVERGSVTFRDAKLSETKR